VVGESRPAQGFRCFGEGQVAPSRECGKGAEVPVWKLKKQKHRLLGGKRAQFKQLTRKKAELVSKGRWPGIETDKKQRGVRRSRRREPGPVGYTKPETTNRGVGGVFWQTVAGTRARVGRGGHT